MWMLGHEARSWMGDARTVGATVNKAAVPEVKRILERFGMSDEELQVLCQCGECVVCALRLTFSPSSLMPIHYCHSQQHLRPTVKTSDKEPKWTGEVVNYQ